MDMNRVTRLYPQYQRSQDRRQQNIPVAVERRSGNDRRGGERVSLDKQLTKDIYDVKSKVARIDSLSPKFFESSVTTQAPVFSALNFLGLIKQCFSNPIKSCRPALVSASYTKS